MKALARMYSIALLREVQLARRPVKCACLRHSSTMCCSYANWCDSMRMSAILLPKSDQRSRQKFDHCDQILLASLCVGGILMWHAFWGSAWVSEAFLWCISRCSLCYNFSISFFQMLASSSPRDGWDSSYSPQFNLGRQQDLYPADRLWLVPIHGDLRSHGMEILRPVEAKTFNNVNCPQVTITLSRS